MSPSIADGACQKTYRVTSVKPLIRTLSTNLVASNRILPIRDSSSFSKSDFELIQKWLSTVSIWLVWRAPVCSVERSGRAGIMTSQHAYGGSRCLNKGPKPDNGTSSEGENGCSHTRAASGAWIPSRYVSGLSSLVRAQACVSIETLCYRSVMAYSRAWKVWTGYKSNLADRSSIQRLSSIGWGKELGSEETIRSRQCG